MDFSEFQVLAGSIYESIPDEYRSGVEGISVERTTVGHPSLPDVYTLGECRTESYPTEFGGAGIVQSVVVLYYGSFVALSRAEESWDWEAETFETIVHEIQHHLESLADDESLEELDYAEDQNFARREGEPFDPLFYRSGIQVGARAWEVDGDVFIEVEVGSREVSEGFASAQWEGREYRLDLGEGPREGLVTLAEIGEGPGELVAAIVQRSGLREWLRSIFG